MPQTATRSLRETISGFIPADRVCRSCKNCEADRNGLCFRCQFSPPVNVAAFVADRPALAKVESMIGGREQFAMPVAVAKHPR